MPKSTLSVLKLRPVTTPLTLRLSQATVKQLRTLEARLEKEAPDWKFDVSEIVEDALREAMETATLELDRLKSPSARTS